jgi:hypothetical protein
MLCGSVSLMLINVFSRIVLLPGFGTTGIERWGIEREIQEHSQHFSACSHVRLLWFDFEPSFSDQFSWRTILDYGHDLLQALSDYKQHSPVSVAIRSQMFHELTP